MGCTCDRGTPATPCINRILSSAETATRPLPVAYEGDTGGVKIVKKRWRAGTGDAQGWCWGSLHVIASPRQHRHDQTFLCSGHRLRLLFMQRNTSRTDPLSCSSGRAATVPAPSSETCYRHFQFNPYQRAPFTDRIYHPPFCLLHPPTGFLPSEAQDAIRTGIEQKRTGRGGPHATGDPEGTPGTPQWEGIDSKRTKFWSALPPACLRGWATKGKLGFVPIGRRC